MNIEKHGLFHFIQMARCFAALLVVADHALLDYNGIYGAPNKDTELIAWRLGNFGVYIFFIISGFVITVGNLDNFNRGKTRDFLVKRFIRIVPMY
ncbi:MAG TPA: acyltransferase family protein [Cellvibrionaceae bacterium]